MAGGWVEETPIGIEPAEEMHPPLASPVAGVR